jgi:hypothetical protein
MAEADERASTKQRGVNRGPRDMRRIAIRFASATFPAHKYLIEGPPPCTYRAKILWSLRGIYLQSSKRGDVVHDGGSAMISQLTQNFHTALETPHLIRWYKAGMLFLMAVSLSPRFLFHDLTFCSHFSCGTLSKPQHGSYRGGCPNLVFWARRCGHTKSNGPPGPF